MKNRNSIVKLFALFASLLILLPGCKKSFEVHVIYTADEGIRDGAPVMYQGEQIGTVNSISRRDASDDENKISYINLGIDAEYEHALYHQMEFLVRQDDEKGSVEIHDAPVRRKRIVENGDLVVGTSESDDLAIDFGQIIGDALREAQEQLNEHWPEIQQNANAALEEARLSIEKEWPSMQEKLREELPQLLDEVNQALQEELSEQDFDALMEELNRASLEANEQIAIELKRLEAELKHQRD